LILKRGLNLVLSQKFCLAQAITGISGMCFEAAWNKSSYSLYAVSTWRNRKTSHEVQTFKYCVFL